MPVYLYLYVEIDLSELETELESLFTEFGLTEEELDRLYDHLMRIEFDDLVIEKNNLN